MKKLIILAAFVAAATLTGCSSWGPIEDRDVTESGEIITESVTLPGGRVAECVLWDHFPGSAGDEQRRAGEMRVLRRPRPDRGQRHQVGEVECVHERLTYVGVDVPGQ